MPVNHSTHLSAWPMGWALGGAQSVWAESVSMATGSAAAWTIISPILRPCFSPAIPGNTEHPAGRRASKWGIAGPRRCGGEPSQERTPESGLMLAARPPFKHGCFCVHKRSPFIREHIGRVNVHYFHSQSRSAGVNRTNGPWKPRRGRSIIFLRVSSAWQARRHGQHAGRQTGKRDGKRWVSLKLSNHSD